MQPIPRASPGGSSGALQYNNAGSLSGITGWSTNGTTTLTGSAGSILSLPAGTEAAPSLNFNSAGTGIYARAANRLTFTLSGQNFIEMVGTTMFLSGTLGILPVGSIGSSPSVTFDAPASGVLTLSNSAGTGFDRIQFGGTNNTFPALLRSTTALHCKLADNSGFAPFSASAFSVGATAGIDFSGAITNLTVVKGIVTAAS